MTHLAHSELRENIGYAARQVAVGGIYIHYKYPDKRYRILGFGIQEENEKVCVIYCDTSAPDVHFVRDLDSWVQEVKSGGKKINRFTLE